ncbi:MAG: FG-GAP-like repeat-containing protein [Vicinamibacterales bacterium]
MTTRCSTNWARRCSTGPSRAGPGPGRARRAFLQRAVEAFDRTLAIDSENVTAHYALSLLHAELGDASLAARHREAHLRYTLDEQARNRVIAEHRAAHPGQPRRAVRRDHRSAAEGRYRGKRVRDIVVPIRSVRSSSCPRPSWCPASSSWFLRSRPAAPISSGPAASERRRRGAPARFVDVTEAAGLGGFRRINGAEGEKLLPETTGGESALVDVDNDGDLDVVLVNGRPWPWSTAAAEAPSSAVSLYLNDGQGRFTDATAAAGLAVRRYGMGVAAGDFDNDGWTDLFITAVGQNVLLENVGGQFPTSRPPPASAAGRTSGARAPPGSTRIRTAIWTSTSATTSAGRGPSTRPRTSHSPAWAGPTVRPGTSKARRPSST